MKYHVKNSWSTFLVLSMVLLVIAGCYEFDYVNQPGSAPPDSSFVVQISATTTSGNGNTYIPYFGILLPIGWTVQDSIRFICDSTEGVFVYSDSLSIAMENKVLPPANYYWWVSAGVDSVIYNLDDTYLFDPVIKTDKQIGNFYLSYMLGSSSQSYGGLGEIIRENKLITIGLPDSITVISPLNDGPGSLREAIDNIDFYGTITFELDQNDTINLTEQLVVKKECRIKGPADHKLVISGNHKTGIFYLSGSPVISNLLLTGGCSEAGGGIYCDQSSPVLRDIIISGNKAVTIGNYYGGGGMYCSYASPVLENVTISSNSSNNRGGGIYFNGACHPVFDSIKRCDIYLNQAVEGNDVYWSSYPDRLNLVLDTFSVLNPTKFHAFPISEFEFDILHGKFEQSNADMYVAPHGNNSNSGLSANTPLKNIHAACSKILADSINMPTIHLLDGVYSPSLTEEFFPISLPDYVCLSGDSATGVVLDAEELSPVVMVKDNSVNRIYWLTITHGIGGGYGQLSAGLSCYMSDLLLEHVAIAYNNGTGVYCEFSDMIMRNCTISDNTNGGLSIYDSSPLLENVMISRNGSGTSYYGGIRFGGGSNSVLHNVSIIGNSAAQGGGIVASGSENHPVSVTLNQVTIRDNTAVEGGGIYCERSDLNLSDVTNVNNTAHMGGGIFYLYGNNINFDTLHRCNIHSNRAFQGNDFYNSPGHIVVDTFSVLNPTEFHVYQAGNTTYDILHGKYAQTDSDLFVSPTGDNNNSGITPEEPLKNIHCAMSKMLPAQPHTIRLLDGIYSPSGNNEFFPVRMYDKINLSGASMATVILDAEQTGGVIDVKNITSPRISDMTITGGEASSGGGIECESSSLSLKNLLITGNNAEYSGGGLIASFCNPVIEDCDFIANSAESGGGLSFVQSNPVLQNVRMSENFTSTSGGGIYCTDFSQLTMKNVSIFRNTALELGGGICSRYSQNSELLFDETERCNIYLNRAAEGGDIYFSGTAHVVVDTFTVMNPMKFHASPRENFTFDIQNSLFEQENADLYVSPVGDNSRSGLSETEALKDIYVAATKIKTDSTNPRSIHLLEGTYRSSSNKELFPIYLPDYSSLKGESSGKVILDAEEQNTVVSLLEKSNILLSGMTIKGGSGLQGGGISCEGSNLSLQDIVISDNIAWRGSGIYSSNSTLSVRDAQVIKNTSRDWYGNSSETPGIYLILSHAVIENSVIAENEAPGFIVYPTGIGLDCLYSGLLLRNSTVSGNTSKEYGSYEPYWPAGISFYESKPVIINSIIFGNYPEEIHFETYEPDTITVSYSDIRGGMGGIISSGVSSYVNWLEGNIDEDPLFTSEGDHPCRISAASPCRNTGTPDTTGMFLPLRDLAGNPRIWEDRIDMGAYEWNNVGMADVGSGKWDVGCRIFPNPFREAANIYFRLEEAARVKVSVFNNMGQLVDVPVEACFSEGEHTVSWNPGELPEGIYMCRLQAGRNYQACKMIINR